LAKIKADETELLKFGVRWLKGVLFKPENAEAANDATDQRA
jgi:hypothetical protein